MISTDVEYVKKLVSAGLIKSPCLELGVVGEGANNRELILNSGVTYFGTDMVTECFNTYGRRMFFPSNISIGAVIIKE